MAKQQSFAEKAAKKKKKDLSTYVKYIKSVKSDKTGYWRFNEQMIEVKAVSYTHLTLPTPPYV